MATVDTELGNTSVRKLMTWLTSVSRRLMTSPLWRFSLLCHSDLRILSSIRCCMRFLALMPRMFFTHTEEMLMAKLQSTRIAMMPTAQYRLPGLEWAAISMAFCSDHTEVMLTATAISPNEALSTAWKRLPFHAAQSHTRISFAVKMLSSVVKYSLNFLNMSLLS